eukprot:TRINITY_DN5670_c0_g1_i3.p1 TRINITY_DN5670_c0_g1~~TRINITY_DN5670_c0_g1_i3.p1  ORF type:complete len:360 (+),score=70.91 TRINITY_DN5670_c0_g1_i3:1548-2627(+)
MTEHGPFSVNPDGTTLADNPYSWNKAANIIYIEAPCGVGYSYATNGNYTTGDNQTAADNLAFVKTFLTMFPKYVGRKFYVAGESYAGHYVPQLAWLILSSGVTQIQFSGILVGNPSMEFTIDAQSYFPFMASHALADDEVFKAAEKACNGQWYPPPNQLCQTLQQEMTKNWLLINPYDVYAECNGPQATGGCLTQQLFFQPNPSLVRSQTVIPCINVTATYTYLNLLSVKRALGVHPSVINREWNPCSQILNYNQYNPTVLPLYTDMLSLYPKFSIIVYSGDADTCVPFPGTEAAVDSLNLTKTDNWRPWLVNGQVAGFVKGYGKLSYATVKGAGHMVPTFKPVQALELFRRFITGKPL